MNFPSREIVNSLRKEYPVGARVELLKMNDVQAPPMGIRALRELTGIQYGCVCLHWASGNREIQFFQYGLRYPRAVRHSELPYRPAGVSTDCRS